MERIGAGRNHGGRYPTRENYEPNPNQRRHSPVQVGDDRTYPIDSICQIGLLVTFLPAPLHAQSRTIAHNPESVDCPSNPSKPPSDRKSTRLNSSHLGISYAVFCLKKIK